MTGLIDFSIDAISNDLGAPPINFQEGQPAGTVNNSSRALMAALACWRDDNAGALVATRGAGDVYAVTTSQVFAADTPDKTGTASVAHTLSFTVDAANQGPAKLALDGCPAKALRRPFGRELGPGDLSFGVVYRVSYIPALGVYVVVSPSLERPGRITFQGDAAADAGWLACDGSAVSRTAYAALFAVIGSTYGAGDGATTFDVPNFNGGRAPMGPGLSGVGGIAGILGSAGGTEVVQLTADQMPTHAHAGTTGGAGSHDHGGSVTAAGQHSHGGATAGAGGHNHTGTTNSAGGHNHTGSTDPAGHSHQYTTASIKNATAGPGNSATGLWAGNDTPVPDSITNTSNTFTTSGVADHAHGFVTNGVGDHVHGIALDGQHQHGITVAPDHAHAFATSEAGGGLAHSNMPPGLVVAFFIKA